MIIDIRNLYKDYLNGEMVVPVLKDVSFSVNEGEFVSIMGRSGSGKSTLMNIIGCLDRQTSGTYLFNGQDVSGMSDDVIYSQYFDDTLCYFRMDGNDALTVEYPWTMVETQAP